MRKYTQVVKTYHCTRMAYRQNVHVASW